MNDTLSRPRPTGSILTSLVLGLVSLSFIALLGGFGVTFMGGVIKHKKALATAEAAAPAVAAPAAAATAPAPVAAATPAPAPKAAKASPAKAEAKPAAPVAQTKAAAAGAPIEIETHAMQFLYTVTEFTVKSGEKVTINFKNTSTTVPQPHNLIFCNIGKKGVVEAAAMALMTDPKALEKGYVPDTEEIFAHTKLLQPNESEILEFTAPAPGKYDYLCTFPGHWILMKGVMTVE